MLRTNHFVTIPQKFEEVIQQTPQSSGGFLILRRVEQKDKKNAGVAG